MDSRKIKTRSAVYEAYYRLLQRDGYDAINANALIKEAGIGRSTFYDNFRSTQDVLKSICNNLCDHVFSKVHQKEFGHDFSEASSGYSPNQAMSHILYHFLEGKQFLEPLFKSGGSSIFESEMRARLFPFFFDLADTSEYCIESVPRKITAIMMTESFLALARHWVDMGCIAKPEQVAHFFIRTFRKNK